MGVKIYASALKHGITPEEIRCVITYPLVMVPVVSRVFTDARPALYVGRFNENEPLIEVIAETSGGTTAIFHAMLLRTATVQHIGLEAYIRPGDLARNQRR